MSSVRMCDKCGYIFSENAADWSTFSGSVQRQREDGSRYFETIQQDACPECTAGARPTAPRLAIPSQPAAPRISDGKPDYDRIAELERQNGIGQAATVTGAVETAPGDSFRLGSCM